MSNPYPVLTYRGDVSKSEFAQTGQLLGWDEVLRPYEVLDAVHVCDPELASMKPCETCGFVPDRKGHTHVFLQYAQPETMKAQGQAYMLDAMRRGLL